MKKTLVSTVAVLFVFLLLVPATAYAFSQENQEYRLPKGYAEEEAELLLCNYPRPITAGVLHSYEVRVFRWLEERA